MYLQLNLFGLVLVTGKVLNTHISDTLYDWTRGLLLVFEVQYTARKILKSVFQRLSVYFLDSQYYSNRFIVYIFSFPFRTFGKGKLSSSINNILDHY